MNDGGRFCPHEDCDRNRNGYCAARAVNVAGIAAASAFMPGQTGFMSPFGPVIGMLGTNVNEEDSGEWPAWINCPRHKEEDLRK